MDAMSADTGKPVRISKPKIQGITYSEVEEADLPELAAGMSAAFGDSFFNQFEPPELRPDPDTRWKRTAFRNRAFFLPENRPHMLMEKACLPNGKIIGTAWWYKPGAPIKNHFWQDPNAELTPEVVESRKGLVIEKWNALFESMDSERKRLIDEPHWFIAPLWVLPEYHGQGVGRKLLERTFERADKSDPPVPIFLEAMPDAVEFYKSLNFKPIPDTPAKWEYIRRGPAKVL